MAAWLTATAVWTINLSRVSFRVVTLPLVASVALALLWRGLRRRHLPTMGWAGLATGLSLYTYLAAPFGLVALALFALCLLAYEGKGYWWKGWLMLAGSASLASLPLVAYFLGHPESLLARAGQVVLVNLVPTVAWL